MCTLPEALDVKHPSISEGVKNIQPELFDKDELRQIYEDLIDSKVGGMEERVAHANLVRMLHEDYIKKSPHGEQKLPEDAGEDREGLLLKIIEHARSTDLNQKDYTAMQASYSYKYAAKELIGRYINEPTKIDNAISVAKEASSLENLDPIARQEFFKDLSELYRKIGDEKHAEEAIKEGNRLIGL